MPHSNFKQSYFHNYNSLIALKSITIVELIYMYNKLMFLDWCIIKFGRFFIKVYPTPLIYISEVMIPKPSVCP